MRLYLSSYHLGKKPGLFTDMACGNCNIAVILNACDSLPPESKPERLSYQINELKNIRLSGTDLDLRNYFGDPESLRNDISKFGGVWIPGGNTFVLRKAMQESGFDIAIKELLREDKISYGGYSAGICVLAPNLKAVEAMDDPQQVMQVYGKDINWEGLGILDYMPIPHYKSDHPETLLADKQIEILEREGIPFKPLRDGEVIYYNG
jgi:dipeptidase E